MNYPFLLKFSSVTNLSDARYAAGMWADFIGFSFDPASPDYIEPARAKEIAGWINGPLVTGEFGNQPKEWIEDFIKGIPLHAIQLPAGYEDLSVKDFNLPILLWVEDAVQTPMMEHAKCLITNNSSLIEPLKSITDLSVIYQAKETSAISDIGQYEGIAFQGKNETSPGIRNQDDWTALLEPFMD